MAVHLLEIHAFSNNQDLTYRFLTDEAEEIDVKVSASDGKVAFASNEPDEATVAAIKRCISQDYSLKSILTNAGIAIRETLVNGGGDLLTVSDTAANTLYKRAHFRSTDVFNERPCSMISTRHVNEDRLQCLKEHASESQRSTGPAEGFDQIETKDYVHGDGRVNEVHIIYKGISITLSDQVLITSPSAPDWLISLLGYVGDVYPYVVFIPTKDDPLYFR